MPSPLLIVTDRLGANRPLIETVRAVLAGGARWIWFRDRDLDLGARRALAEELLAIIHLAGGRLVIGGDADLAATIGADGVHLSAAPPASSNPPPHPEVPRSGLEGGLQESLRDLEPSFEGVAARRHLRMRVGVGEAGAEIGLAHRIAAARNRLGPDALVGVSAHGIAEIREAAEAGADYATLSPIFATASKPGYGPALGLDGLREAARLGLPLIALAGIDAGNARACLEAGAAGIAVMGGLMRASDPEGETRSLLRAVAPAS